MEIKFTWCVCVCVRTCACVCVFLSLQHFDMIKDKTYGVFKTKTYGVFKTYFYGYNTFPADNLLIVRPLKVLPCYLKVASG